ncbi:MAG TPA: HD domain-containing phosphohydrolase [Gemmatimonadales bacterium]|jgi:HD-GYP domain-containing protein (c-di-GMP phosphodiesterase class II)|nr:HD domain-containing phosphohydrolase [Gemmatimonadales bacterium]
MKHAESWLREFGRAMAAHALYGPGHQSRRDSSARVLRALEELFESDHRPTFTFLEDTVVYRTLPVHALKEWSWGHRLGAAGVRRLEFSSAVTQGAIEDFLASLHDRLVGDGQGGEPARWPGIEAGDVAVQEAAGTATVREPEPVDPSRTGSEPYALGEEVEAVQFVWDRVAGGEAPPVDDLEGVVRALALALHSEGELLIPLVELRSQSDHLTRHSVNTAVLAMSFGEWLGLTGGDIRGLGRAALLHDIGMSRVPVEVFRTPALTAQGKADVARHPAEGAKLLLAGSSRFELAATVAYEHHLRHDGQGYPARRFHKDLHYISRLIAVCSAYGALRAERSYRPAYTPEAALAQIEAGAGPIYDPGIAGSFLKMMWRWQHRVIPAAAS